MTEWKAILPIEYKWSGLSVDNNVINGKNCFGESIEPPRSQLYYLNWEKLSQGLVQTTKTEKILILDKNIQRSISGLSKKKMEDAVILLQPDSSDINSLELFSKALFANIVRINFGKKEKVALRIGILFDHKDAIFEFIRLFSIFYPEGKQSDMRNVQIALCKKNELAGGIDDVVVMLTGERLSSTYSYARLFAYHHAGNTLEYLPLLEYLTVDKNKAKQGGQELEDIGLFPFDLCLPIKLESQRLDWQHSWFFQRMKHILNTNIQDKDYGCLINDIHIRLGSKLHLNRFYEAELLFHNMGNVARFAYMITQELLYGEQKLNADQRVLLLGYEKYSSMLLMQVEYWIKKSNQFSEVNVAVVYDSEDEKEVKVRPYFDQQQDVHGKPGSVQIVTIVPIGTTLSTVYKMQNMSRIQLQEYFGDQWAERSESRNFCLILVNEDLCVGSLSKITKKYWENVEWGSHLVTLTRQRKEEEKIRVRYFIEAEAKWTDPQDCEICRSVGKDARPIIDGKHSNTMPGAIFSLWGEHAGTFKKLVGDVAENRKRIRTLYGNVFYSHIYDGNNHFQFYIDFKKLYEENKDAVDSYLREKRVIQNAFHVIVSPLQLTNSTFVKAVIDNAFDGNARFLYMNITDAYREEIRAKFSYLTQEFRQFRYTNPKAKFAFHFVDTSIVTGSQLNRARLLLEMLLNQSNIDYGDVSLFDTVFLLVNRCSYDTAHYFVHKPEENMRAYIHLAIPSYNTENDFCPACKMITKFQLLGKRSSTERLSREFLRLQEKHKKRIFKEYRDWMTGSNPYLETSDKVEDGVVLNGSAYFGWLRQWLYVCVGKTNEKPVRFWSFVPQEAKAHGDAWEADMLAKIKSVQNGIDIYAKEEWENDRSAWKELSDKEQFKKRNDYLNKLCGPNLNDVAEYISDEKQKADFLSDAKDIIKTQLIGVRDYMRLTALQKSYEELENVLFTCDSMKDAEYREVIINLIGDAILNTNAREVKSQWPDLKDAEKSRFLLTYNVECLISYVKVLSRAQIVNYYEYRQAIVGVMSDMLRILYRKDWYKKFLTAEKNKGDVPKNWEKIVSLLGNLRKYDDASEEYQLRAKLCYQVHMTLVHRMSDLQISSRVDGNKVLDFMQLYSEMLDCYFQPEAKEEISYIDMPSASKNIIRYLKAAKSATMTSNDDVPCLILASTPYELEKELNNFQKHKTVGERQNLLDAAKYIYLENTRMLYTGMADIKNKISAETLAKIESDRPADSFAEYMKKLSQEVEQCLSSCYGNLDSIPNERDLLFQNPLSNFCRFWHKSTKEAPVGKEGGNNPVAYMLRYFMRLEELSGESGKKQANDELPYYYEELCRTLCGITGFQMCYFTYCHAGNYPEIFAQSGYYVDFMMSGILLTPVRIDEIIRLARKKENELLPGIARVIVKVNAEKTEEKLAEKEYGYLVLFIPLIDDMESGDGFYVVLQTNEPEKLLGNSHSELNWTVLRKARDVLFLRQRLQEVLSRDYTILINYRFDCSYVRPISRDTEGYPAAMHLSDLHIQQDMSERSPNICQKIREALKECGRSGHSAEMDLLIISGDIVESRDANAPRMEKNYQYAERLLNDIVSTLWKDGSGYLPHDWRRRIIISTGNHDYASMNQYQAAQKGRVLTSAFPTEGESGTMSKFAYFIEFLIRYLDVPVDQLLYNDLNEIRSYRNLNLKILLLNCSGKATPRRTNKMGINEDKVAKLLERDVWNNDAEKIYNENGDIVKRKPFCLVIGHYSPEYQLSYFLDKYDVLPGWVWEPAGNRGAESSPMNSLVYSFQDAVQKELKFRSVEETGNADENAKEQDAREQFKKEFDYLNTAMKVLENLGESSPGDEVDKYYKRLWFEAVDMPKGKIGKDEAVRKAAEKAAKEVTLRVRQNELYQQLKKYYNWLKKIDDTEEWSEEISRLFYEIDESIRMGEQDKQLFEKFIKQRVPDKDLYLAGHIHAYAENQSILVADKLLDESREEMHGYIIQNMVKEVNPGGLTYQYSRFGVKPTR